MHINQARANALTIGCGGKGGGNWIVNERGEGDERDAFTAFALEFHAIFSQYGHELTAMAACFCL